MVNRALHFCHNPPRVGFIGVKPYPIKQSMNESISESVSQPPCVANRAPICTPVAILRATAGRVIVTYEQSPDTPTK